MKRIALVSMALLALSACATPETRVRTALMDAGLSQPMAACMADRMIDRLSLIQLNKLNGLKKLRGQDMRKVTVEEFLRRTRALQDPEILGVATSSGLICAVKAY
jgi:type IV pilus biogenesis protein CpaD/CtpE